MIWDFSREVGDDGEVHHIFADSDWAGCPAPAGRRAGGSLL